jgi:hypothetical protein
MIQEEVDLCFRTYPVFAILEDLAASFTEELGQVQLGILGRP